MLPYEVLVEELLPRLSKEELNRFACTCLHYHICVEDEFKRRSGEYSFPPYSLYYNTLLNAHTILADGVMIKVDPFNFERTMNKVKCVEGKRKVALNRELEETFEVDKIRRIIHKGPEPIGISIFNYLRSLPYYGCKRRYSFYFYMDDNEFNLNIIPTSTMALIVQRLNIPLQHLKLGNGQVESWLQVTSFLNEGEYSRETVELMKTCARVDHRDILHEVEKYLRYVGLLVVDA